MDEQERNGQQAFLYDWYWCFYHCQELSIDALLKVKKRFYMSFCNTLPFLCKDSMHKYLMRVFNY